MDRRQRALAALSLGNLILVPAWLELLFLRPGTSYFMKRLPDAADYGAALLALLLFAALFFALLTFAQRSRAGRVVLGLAVLAAVAIPLDALRTLLPKELGLGALLARGPLVLGGVAAVVLALAALAVRYRSRLFGLATAAVLLLAPFAGLNIVKALHAAATASADSAMETPQLGTTPVLGRAPGHVVWMIFDELDYRLVFQDRPKGLELPELDRLRAQAIFATDAYAPAIETRRSLPSLLTGRVVEEAVARGGSTLELTFQGAEGPFDFRAVPTVFQHARAHGAETEIVGWYHPYCRLLAASLSRCTWRPVNQTVVGRLDSDSFFSSFVAQLQGLSPLAPRQLHIAAYESVREDALAALGRGARGLQFFHFPVPHTPSIYDGRRGETTLLRWSNVTGYPENLMLADRLLGDLRRTMEAQGTWDRASVVLSTDHPWRQARAFDGKTDDRVPFLLKLPGQTTTHEHAGRFETVRTGRVVLELLGAERPTVEDATRWMDRTEAAFAGDFR